MIKALIGKVILFSPLVLLNLTVLSGSIVISVLFFLSILANIKRIEILLSLYIIASINSDYFENSLFNGGSVRVIQVCFLFSYALGYVRIRKSSMKEDIFLLLCTTILLCLWTVFSKFDSDFTALISILNILFFSFFFSNTILSRAATIKMIDFILMGALITVLFASVNLMSNFDNFGYIRVTLREGLNENKSGMILGYIGTLISFSFFYHKSFIHRLTAIVFLTMTVLAIVLVGSRSPLIGLTLALLWALIYRNKLGILIIVVCLTSALFFVFKFDTLIYDFQILDRFTYQNVADSNGSSRFELWNKFIPYIVRNNFLFGIGFGPAEMYSLAKLNQWSNVPHNMFVDIFVQLGLVGSLLFSLLLLLKFVRGKQKSSSPKNLITLLPIMLFIFSIVTGFGESVFNERFFYNNFMLLGLLRFKK
jgi:hypothetical protein